MKSVVIIGAGPAGSVAAIGLSRAGIPVTIIEQHRFPRDKVCGECLSALGVEALERLGIRQSLRALHPAMLSEAILHAPDGSSARLPLRRPMWGISRLALDSFLLEQARANGAKVMQPARMEAGAGVRDLATNQLSTLSADFIMDARGRAPFVTGDLGLKAHFRAVAAPENAIGLFGVRGHYGGIAPIEGGLWNIAFSVPARRVAHSVTRASRSCEGSGLGRYARVTGKVLDGVFEEIKAENRGLDWQMQRAVRVTDWLTSPLPRFGVQRHWPHGIIPLGNAAAAVEPIGGEGMGLAMRSAELAAESVVEAIRRGMELDLRRLRSEYRKLWHVRSLACRAAGIAVSSPWLCRLVVPLLHVDDPLTAVALRALGKA